MHRLLTIVTLFLFLFSSESFAVDQPKTLVEVKLLLPGDARFRYAGYYAAIDQGYYRAAGLEVSILSNNPAQQEPIPSVISGQADFSIAGSELSVASMQGEPVVAVAALYQTSPAAWLVLADQKIDSLRDLVGRQLEHLSGPGFPELQAIFLQAGIDPEGLKLKQGDGSVAALLAHETDAMEVVVTDQPYELAQKSVAYRLIRSRSFGVDFYGDILFTRKQLVKQQRARVEAFRRASLEGWVYALNNLDQTVERIHTQYAPSRSLGKLSFEATEMLPLIMADLIEVGHMSEARWSFISQTQRDLGLAPKDKHLDAFIYDPNPTTDYSWLFQWFGFALLALVISGAGVTWVIWLNRNLRLQIEERHLAEAELRRADERQSRIIETAPSPLVITDLGTGDLLYINEQARELLSFDQAKQSSEKQVFQFFSEPKERDLFFEELNNRSRVDHMEIQLGSSTSNMVCVMVSAMPIELEDRSCLMIGLADITSRKVLEEKLRTQATIDGLTHCFNRSHFFESANLELTRSQRYQRPMSVVMLDIDHFKGINDTWGHEIGDLALISFCDAIRLELRSADIFGRIGGEEFVVVLPETEASAGLGVAERMRAAIEGMRLPLPQGDILQFTVSIGLAPLLSADTEASEPIARADAALYQAKNRGRNQVVLSEKKPNDLITGLG